MNHDHTRKLFQDLHQAIHDAPLVRVQGKVVQVVGTIIKASIPNVKIGELCRLVNRYDKTERLAEIIGFSESHALLTPMGDMLGLSTDTLVIPTGRIHSIPVGPNLLGRVLNGLGQPCDGLDEPIQVAYEAPVYADSPNPLTRTLVEEPLPLGIRAIDGLLTCGEGQRMGIFAAAGGGKSVLLGMIARESKADVIVIALIGERGREVREFIERDLGVEGLKRSVVVVATSDRPAVERVKSAYVATAIAEYYRDQGKKVLLLMDSVTRFARAQREIGLASGEPPTRRGFPPSVFADLPRLLERAGQSDKGSITGLYTVLVEGDDMTEPVADEVRSILDGHIILSRKLAAKNHYPAIDILASTSRVMSHLITPSHAEAAARLRTLLAKYSEVELLVKIGEYVKGSDPEADMAIAKMDRMNEFLRQGIQEHMPYEETLSLLQQVVF